MKVSNYFKISLYTAAVLIISSIVFGYLSFRYKENNNNRSGIPRLRSDKDTQGSSVADFRKNDDLESTKDILKEVLSNQDISAYDEQDRLQRLSWQKTLQERRFKRSIESSKQSETDVFIYGEEIASLYEKADIRRGDSTDIGTREAAFNELLSKYPDSYSTARILALNGITFAAENDIQEAEWCYDMLLDIEDRKSVRVLFENGADASATLHHALAWAYYKNDRIDEAKSQMESLAADYPDCTVQRKDRRGNIEQLSVSQAVIALNVAIDYNLKEKRN